MTVTGYTVTASPDTATATVDGGTYQATLTGLAHAATDTFAVTVTNAGTSGAATYTATTPTTVSGTVLAPSGTPVAGALVDIFSDDPPDDTSTDWTPDQLGTTSTDASGNWSFTVPPYSSLPAKPSKKPPATAARSTWRLTRTGRPSPAAPPTWKPNRRRNLSGSARGLGARQRQVSLPSRSR